MGTKLELDIPEEFEDVPKLELSLAMRRMLKGKFARLSKLEKILSKSKLSQAKAKKIADDISSSLSKEYEKLRKDQKK